MLALYVRYAIAKSSLTNAVRGALGDRSGATAIEYGLIAALIAVAAITAMTTVGTNLTSKFTTIPTKLQ